MNIDWNDLFTAIALVLIFEGLMPFLSPTRMKKSYKTIIELPENTLRMVGLSGVIVGILILFMTS